MASCCNKKEEKASPDCMASKSTTVKTPEGEDVDVSFNMGTGEVVYHDKKSCCSGSEKEKGTGCCSKKD